jgi:hypothetical protein
MALGTTVCTGVGVIIVAAALEIISRNRNARNDRDNGDDGEEADVNIVAALSI